MFALCAPLWRARRRRLSSTPSASTLWNRSGDIHAHASISTHGRARHRSTNNSASWRRGPRLRSPSMSLTTPRQRWSICGDQHGLVLARVPSSGAANGSSAPRAPVAGRTSTSSRASPPRHPRMANVPSSQLLVAAQHVQPASQAPLAGVGVAVFASGGAEILREVRARERSATSGRHSCDRRLLHGGEHLVRVGVARDGEASRPARTHRGRSLLEIRERGASPRSFGT